MGNTILIITVVVSLIINIALAFYIKYLRKKDFEDKYL